MQNKRIRNVRRYHYDMVKICRETDVIFTRCRECKQLYPSTLEYFRKDSDKDAQLLIQPVCRKCATEKEKAYKQKIKEAKRIAEEQKPI